MLTRVEEIVRPRPVPPNRRVVDPSAWLKASKIVSCLSAGTPTPVSLTRKCSRVQPSRRVSSCSSTRTWPLRGELDGVAHEVREHLLEPPRVADDGGGHAGRDVGDELEPLLLRAKGERLQHVVDDVAQR